MNVSMNVVSCAFASEAEVKQLARSYGFVTRKSPITGMRFLLAFTTGLQNTPTATLAQIVTFLSSVCGIAVSPQAIDERLTVAAMAFMRCCLERALAMAMATRPRTSPGGLLAHFDHIYIIDSTSFELHPSLQTLFRGSSGTASGAAMRVQLLLDYVTGQLWIQIGGIALCDAPTLRRLVDSSQLDASGRCLFLSDLGYFKIAAFQAIDHQQNFFLSKFMRGVTLRDPSGAKIDLQALLESGSDSLNRSVCVEAMNCHPAGKKLPEAIINRRLRTANRAAQCKHGRTITAAYRLFLQYAIFLTNLPVTFPMDTLFTLYRVRWQIELIFKTWKPILSIHSLRSASSPW